MVLNSQFIIILNNTNQLGQYINTIVQIAH